MKMNNLKAIVLLFVILNSISLDICRKIKSKKEKPMLKNHRFSREQEQTCTTATSVSGSGWSCAAWIDFLMNFAKEMNPNHEAVELKDDEECSADKIASSINNNGANAEDKSDASEKSAFSKLFSLDNWKTYIGRAMATIQVINKCVAVPWYKVVWEAIKSIGKALVIGLIGTITAGAGFVVHVALKIATFIKQLTKIGEKCPINTDKKELKQDPTSRGTCFGFISRTILDLVKITKKRKHKSKYRIFRKINEMK